MPEEMLLCSSCDEEKPVSCFYKKNGRSRGYCYSCKEYASIKRHDYHMENKEKYNEMSKVYYEKHKTEKRDYYRNSGEGAKNHRARQAVNNAVRDGKLLKASERNCEDCARIADQYHHESYEKEHYLDVIPLCRSCHSNRHRTYKL